MDRKIVVKVSIEWYNAFRIAIFQGKLITGKQIAREKHSFSIRKLLTERCWDVTVTSMGREKCLSHTIWPMGLGTEV